MPPRLPLLLLLASLAGGCKTPVTVMDDMMLQHFERRVDYRKNLGIEEMWEDLGVKSELFMRDREVRMSRQNIPPSETCPGFIIYTATTTLRQEFQYLIFRREPDGAIRFLGVAEVPRQISSDPIARLDASGKAPVLSVERKGATDRYDLSGKKLRKL